MVNVFIMMIWGSYKDGNMTEDELKIALQNIEESLMDEFDGWTVTGVEQEFLYLEAWRHN